MNLNISSNRSLQNAYLAFYANLSIGFLGLFLNAGVCLIITTHTILRQPFNYLILNLSLSDILVSCSLILNSVLDYFSISYYSISYRASSIICHINTGLTVASLPAACLTLLVMSIERYQAIAVIRFRDLQLSTVCKIIAIIWLVAITTAIIPIVYAKLELHYPYECIMGRIGDFQILILIVVLFIIFSILPIGIMLIVYVMILYKLIHDLSIVQPRSSLMMSRRDKHSRRSILPVLCLSIFSTASSAPFLILTYYTAVNQYYNPSFRAIFFRKYYELWLVTGTYFILTPIINPLLYNLASSKFREVLYSSICGPCCSAVKGITIPIKLVQVDSKSSTAHSNILSANPPQELN